MIHIVYVPAESSATRHLLDVSIFNTKGKIKSGYAKMSLTGQVCQARFCDFSFGCDVNTFIGSLA